MMGHMSSMFLAFFITMETNVDILDTNYTVITNGLESSLTKSQRKQSVLWILLEKQSGNG